jgi:EmrB/QacA subfamily drug resistance transporter
MRHGSGSDANPAGMPAGSVKPDGATAGTVSQGAALVVASMSAFLTPFTSSSVNIALPTIGTRLHLDAVALGWVATAYLLAAAAFLVPCGRLADIRGRKRLFQLGILVDALGSLSGASAQSGAWLILSRGIQGLGGALIFGTGIAILTSVFPPRERGRALGINVAAVYAGLSTGPLIGGLLTAHLGWRSIFLLNAALCAIVSATVVWKLRGEWTGAKGERFDAAGAVIYSLAMVAVIYAFSVLPALWGFGLLAAGLLGLLAFGRWELRQPQPVLDVRLLGSNRLFALSNLAALLHYGATFAVTFLLSLYLQYVKGFSPQHAGLILIAQPVMMVLCSPFAGHLSDRIAPRIVASLGMGVTTLGLLMLTRLDDGSSLPSVIAALIVLGAGFGIFSSPNTNAVMSAVERRHYGVASGMLGTMRLTGQAFSMGMTLLLFSTVIGRTPIRAENHALLLYCMRIAFSAAAALCLAGVFASLARGQTRR